MFEEKLYFIVILTKVFFLGNIGTDSFGRMRSEARSVSVGQRHVRNSVVIRLSRLTEDVVSARRVSIECHYVRVIGGDYDQRVFSVSHLDGAGDRFAKLDSLVERKSHPVLMMGVVDATTYNK